MKKATSKQICLFALLAAVIAVCSQISIKLPSGVPLTLQTFGVALAGYVAGRKYGAVPTVVYILLGAVGAPVFSNFTGGVNVLIGLTGGFIFGFIFLSALCGLFSQNNYVVSVLGGIIGLALCHILGVIQFKFIYGCTLWSAFLSVSLPYIVKDILSIAAAKLLSLKLNKVVNRA